MVFVLAQVAAGGGQPSWANPPWASAINDSDNVLLKKIAIVFNNHKPY
jgi:hypothetical protein